MVESEDNRRFDLRLEASDSGQTSFPLTELLRTADGLRVMLRGVATVLAREATNRPGRVRRFIEEATDIRVVAAPRAGSLVLPLELPPEPPRLDALDGFEPGPELGERSLECLIAGLDQIQNGVDALPAGFDREVLRKVEKLRPAFDRGISAITIERDGMRDNSARIDRDRVEAAHRLINEPVTGPATVEGKLEMVDRSNLACRVDRAERPDVACTFPDALRDEVTAAIGQYVRVSGKGSFQPGREDPEKIEAVSLKAIYEELQFDAAAFDRSFTIDELADEQGVPSSERLLELGPLDWLDEDEAEAFRAAARPR